MTGAARDPAAAPRKIECPQYAPLPEQRHCRYFVAGGGCALPDRPVCTEWLAVNRHRLPIAAGPPAVDRSGPQTDLFAARAAGGSRLVPPPTSTEHAPAVDVAHLAGFTSDDIASWKALGVEIRLDSQTYGELWLVPAYTGKARKEITPEHAATVLRVISAFPGSSVTAFEPSAKAARP